MKWENGADLGNKMPAGLTLFFISLKKLVSFFFYEIQKDGLPEAKNFFSSPRVPSFI